MQSTGPEPAHVPAALAGRAPAGCRSVPGDVLSHLASQQYPHGHPGMRGPMCSVPAYYTWLLAPGRVTAEISTRFTDTQIIPLFLILVVSTALFHKRSLGPQEIPARDSKTYHPLKCGFDCYLLFSHVLYTYFTKRSVKRSTLIPSQTKL